MVSMLLEESSSKELSDLDAISEQHKTALNKVQKEAFEIQKKKMTLAVVKSHAKLLRKYLANDAKNFALVLQLIKEAFFKHGDEKTLKGCITALAFAANESHADLQDFANQILKETADELLVKLRSTIMRVGLQLAVNVDDNTLFIDLKELLDDFTNLDDEVLSSTCIAVFNTDAIFNFVVLAHMDWKKVASSVAFQNLCNYS
ncbi:unnamed protein product [Sphagnum compactum]